MDTKTQILDTALNLFAEQGFEATSLRAITACASVNLAAVHYHFGSKEGLLSAVVDRGFGPINHERLTRLDAARAEAGEDPIELRTLLETFIAPALRVADDPEGGAFLHLVGRLHSDLGKEYVRELLVTQFEELKRRFMPEFARSLPELDLETLIWRMHFVVGAMAHTMIGGENVRWASDGRFGPSRSAERVHLLCAFAEAGLRAPVTAVPNAPPASAAPAKGGSA